MLRQLQPYYANLAKHQAKSPKIHLRDSGLLHQLIGVDLMRALPTRPKVGASWEGFVIEQTLRTPPHDEAFFWATHPGTEIDLILRRGSALIGIECKRTDTPRLTPSIRIALEDLKSQRVHGPTPGRPRKQSGGFNFLMVKG